jgi:hypothetical protein
MSAKDAPLLQLPETVIPRERANVEMSPKKYTADEPWIPETWELEL